MALLALVSIVVVPLAVELIGFVSGRSFRMAPGAIARVALITVILPLVAGMTVRALLPGVADRLEKVVSLITKVLLPLAVLVLLVGSWRVMWPPSETAASPRLSPSWPPDFSPVISWAGRSGTCGRARALECLPPSGYRAHDHRRELSGPTLRGDHPALSRDQRPDWRAVPGVQRQQTATAIAPA
jgi:hypothetical protein